MKRMEDLIKDPNKGSPLNKYASEVIAMRENDVPYKDISIWLNDEHGIVVTHQNIRDWYTRLEAKFKDYEKT